MKKTHTSRQWILVGATSAFSGNAPSSQGDADVTFVTLPHPKTGAGARFLVSNGGKRIQEVLKYEDPPKSWLINNSVQKDGSLHLATPMDPVFLIIPYLEKTKKRFTTLDNVLSDEDFPSSACLCDVDGTSQLSQVCDIKEAVDMNVYRLNEEKTLAWLRKKVDRLVVKLKEMPHINVGLAAKVATFIQSKQSKSSANSQGRYTSYAVGMISEYLNERWRKKLHDIYSQTLDEVESSDIQEPAAKKPKATDTAAECIEDYTKYDSIAQEAPDKKAKKVTAAQRALRKVDKTGMKSISSFFGRKSKT